MAAEPAVLVTRPEGQADALCASLAASGFTPHHQPLLELSPLGELAAHDRQHLLDLDLYQHIIFISANAVRFGMACIEDFWPQLPVGVNWYAIGGSTAALLEERGLSVVTPGQKMSSEGLLGLSQLSCVADQRILIIKGIGGRETLREVLSARGARVDELACYRRSCPVMAADEMPQRLSEWGIEFILISSGEGLQNLLALLSGKESTKFRDIGLVVPSPRVESLAREAGFKWVMTAPNASDEAVLDTLRQWRSGEL